MDAPQSPHLSPDGRHRWDAEAQRWVPAEDPPAERAPVDPGATIVGGWGRPAPPMPSRAGSTIPGWARPQRQPGAPEQQPMPWAPPPSRPPWASPAPGRGTTALPADAAAAMAATVAGALGLVIGAFLAWITASAQGISTSQSGINTPSGDGWFFVVCGLLVAAAAVLAALTPRPWLGLVAAAAALAAAGVTIYEFTDVHGHIADARAAFGHDVGSYGAGLYLLAIGSALALAGGLAEATRARRA